MARFSAVTQSTLLALCLTFAATNVHALECTVADASGTPLNVRSRPNGPILGALHNGTSVFISNMVADSSGLRWANIVPQNGKAGWVARKHLSC
jgi:uncharacterized protein YraI